ncbi:MAG TPA: hypothetical protein DIW37_11135 [Chryseobacterium sp.]|nr:hypothetical protein [Chryseobacterium sp.]
MKIIIKIMMAVCMLATMACIILFKNSTLLFDKIEYSMYGIMTLILFVTFFGTIIFIQNSKPKK